MKKNKFFVTGGYGFIGANFIKKILSFNDNQVINIDNLSSGSNKKNIPEKVKNYCEYIESIKSEKVLDILLTHQPDYLVHFAAESHVDRSIAEPEIFLETNIFGTYNLLECCRKFNLKLNKKIHFHHVSTDEVYGSLSLDESRFTENNQYLPSSPYSASKASSDHLVRAWGETFGLKYTVSNCSNNYGPMQDKEKLIPGIIRNLLDGKKVPIYGDGQNIRDWIHVEDHCDAILHILEKGSSGQKYNVGGDSEKNNVEVVNEILNILKGKGIIHGGIEDHVEYISDRPGHDFRYAINNKKIFEQTGWAPKFCFMKGLTQTVNWYLDN